MVEVLPADAEVPTKDISRAAGFGTLMGDRTGSSSVLNGGRGAFGEEASFGVDGVGST